MPPLDQLADIPSDATASGGQAASEARKPPRTFGNSEYDIWARTTFNYALFEAYSNYNKQVSNANDNLQGNELKAKLDQLSINLGQGKAKALKDALDLRDKALKGDENAIDRLLKDKVKHDMEYRWSQ